MRRKLLTGRSKTVGDRGGCEVSDNDLAALWPLFLNEDMEAARPSLSMPDVEFMIEQRETWRYHGMDPRPLKDAEMTAIKVWYESARAKKVDELGAPLAAVQHAITSQASAHHEENVDLHAETRAELKAQISQLAPASTKRLVVNRYAFISVEDGVSNYFRDGEGEVRPCEDAVPVEGRAYCRLVYVEQQKIGEPGVYYCAGQGTQKADELHNWSTLVRVKTAEECVKPALPKSLHAIGGQKAKVVSENGDTLRVKAPAFGDKIFGVGRGFVEFLPPDVDMPAAAGPPREDVRNNAERAAALAAPRPPATGEEQPAAENNVSEEAMRDKLERPIEIDGHKITEVTHVFKAGKCPDG